MNVVSLLLKLRDFPSTILKNYIKIIKDLLTFSWTLSGFFIFFLSRGFIDILSYHPSLLKYKRLWNYYENFLFIFLLGFYKIFCDLQEHFPLSLRNFTCLEISRLLKILFGVSVNALRFLSFLKDPKANHTETIFEIHYRLLKIVCVRLLDDFMGTADGRRQWLLVRVAHARHRLNKHRTLFSNEPTCCCSLRFQTKSSITYFGFFFKKKAQYTMEYTSHKRNNVYISSGKSYRSSLIFLGHSSQFYSNNSNSSLLSNSKFSR